MQPRLWHKAGKMAQTIMGNGTEVAEHPGGQITLQQLYCRGARKVDLEAAGIDADFLNGSSPIALLKGIRSLSHPSMTAALNALSRDRWLEFLGAARAVHNNRSLLQMNELKGSLANPVDHHWPEGHDPDQVRTMEPIMLALCARADQLDAERRRQHIGLLAPTNGRAPDECIGCGKTIARGRLECIPHTKYCAECAHK